MSNPSSDVSMQKKSGKCKVNDQDHERDHTKDIFCHGHQNKEPRSAGLFRKYLFLNSQRKNKIGNTNEECSRVITRTDPIMEVFHGDVALNSWSSALEARILSLMQPDVVLPQRTSSPEKSATTQLTIFYSGVVNVYDNVSIDEAQALLHLARSSSKSAPIVTHTPKNMDVPKAHNEQLLNFTSLNKFQAADLPLVRRNSLRRFMERRERATNNSPYVATSRKSK